jgi:ubiquitin C-terminal hydrolase
MKNPVGLSNLGNTCYINTCIQCIYNIESFRKFFVLNFHKSFSNVRTDDNLIDPLGNLFKRIHHSSMNNVQHIVPDEFISSMEKIANKMNKRFSRKTQEDINEFLLFLFDVLHTNLGVEVEMIIEENKKTPVNQLLKQSYVEWKKYFEKHYSYIVQSFYGQFHTHCYNNTYDQHSFQPFLILPVHIPINKENISLLDCIEHSTQEEIISDYKNEETNKFMKIKKVTTVWKYPETLIIQIVRFTNSNLVSTKNTKNNSAIAFTDILELDNNNVYQLLSVANHIGTLKSGHYFADCFNPQNKQWYRYDDSSVSLIKEFNYSAAYLLFYKKKI